MRAGSASALRLALSARAPSSVGSGACGPASSARTACASKSRSSGMPDQSTGDGTVRTRPVGALHGPLPRDDTARTRKTWICPGCSPVTVKCGSLTPSDARAERTRRTTTLAPGPVHTPPVSCMPSPTKSGRFVRTSRVFADGPGLSASPERRPAAAKAPTPDPQSSVMRHVKPPRASGPKRRTSTGPTGDSFCSSARTSSADASQASGAVRVGDSASWSVSLSALSDSCHVPPLIAWPASTRVVTSCTSRTDAAATASMPSPAITHSSSSATRYCTE
mmetsp:Transcript_24329/g.84536  ORF Transcript_24329/g.84536 Transcript_24329/m.84536 type:complete len:278 (+) Transcript_24329:621-1454(+)